MTTAIIIVTTLCLAGMAWLVASTIFNIVSKDREQRLKYYRNYKKGNFLLIYLIAIPLFFLAFYYDSHQVALSFFESIKSSVDLVVLKITYNDTAMLMQDNAYFNVAMWLCYVLVVINMAFLAVTIFIRRVENSYRLHALKSAKKVYVIVGYSDKNKNIISSIEKNSHCVLLVDDITDDIKNYAYIQKISYFKIIDGDVSLTIQKLFRGADLTQKNEDKKQGNPFKNKSVEVIVNTLDDKQNLVFCEQLSTFIIKQNLTELVSDDNRGLNVYVFAEPDNEQVFLSLAQKTCGCLHYINKYKLVAMDFVGNYPLTEYMNEEQIDYDTATIKDDVKINVAMIGFGKTNQQIFLTSVANNQFMAFVKTEKSLKLKNKLVNYYIYDKKDAQNDKNLNHNYFRYVNECENAHEEEWRKTHLLPLDGKPANEQFFTLDVNDHEFYKSLRKNLTSSEGKKGFNYLIIAFGTDLQNLDFAEKVMGKLAEWNIEKCTHVFVKVRNDDLKRNYVHSQTPPYVVFGNENELVYNVSQIVDEKMEAMAKDRHICYASTYDASKDDIESMKDDKRSKEEIEAQAKAKAQERSKAIIKWYTQSQTQRESNIYAVLSIKMKLQLMGYTYRSARPMGEEKPFMEKYQWGDKINYAGRVSCEGREEIKYSNTIEEMSLRTNMAKQEHQRWNAYMITQGFIPATIEQIVSGKTKDFNIRIHGNITTFEGLKTWRAMQSKVTGKSEDDCDVIRYDYQIMDEVAWLLNRQGLYLRKKCYAQRQYSSSHLNAKTKYIMKRKYKLEELAKCKVYSC